MTNLKAIFLKASLKSTEEPSNTETLMNKIQDIYNELDVAPSQDATKYQLKETLYKVLKKRLGHK